ncbi:MAG: hypothetical protein LBL04_07440 [Bacteroidales bacterium]|jgi:hypothetical protein|nr:hypothetical protein [Bacteroidales bacterium]
MAQIKNIEGLTVAELNNELSRGGKFVMFQYCVSIVVMTFRRSSDIYFVRAGESTIKHSIGYTLLTLLLGWWGIPWGPIYTIGSLYTNLSGGKDVTREVLNSLNNSSQ